MLAVLTLWSPPSQAWNPLRAAARGVRAIGRGVGGFLGAPVGGFVESATTPAMRNLEASGHRLLQDADGILARQLDRAGTVTGQVVAQTDKALAERLEQVDHSLEARILQVKTSADDSVDHAFGRLDHSLGRLDRMARLRIEQIDVLRKDTLAQLDAVVTRSLSEADQVLARRTEDLRQLVSASIQEADRAAAARIDQLDEVAGRRIGNIDVIATKQGLALEASLLRLAALIGMVALIGFVLWRLFVETGRAWGEAITRYPTRPRRMLGAVLLSAPRFLAQVALAGAGALLLYYLAGVLPHDALARAKRQIDEHRGAFDAAMRSYDFSGVRYHAAQLEILEPERAAVHRGTVRKAELLRAVFSRPSLLQSLDGIKELSSQVEEVEGMSPGDPDLLVVKAYILWQVGATRGDEYEAATLCADALEAGRNKSDRPGGFLLAPLARNYLRAFLHNPYQPPKQRAADAAPDPGLPRLRQVLERAGKAEGVELPQLEHVLEYDRLVAELDRRSSTAYLEMLSAHADYRVAIGKTKKGQAESADALAARNRRNASAETVVAAWRDFDEALQSSQWLADNPAALSAFTLDDAVLSHALYFTAKPAATDLAPRFFAEGKAGPAAPPLLRVEMAPLRVAWAQRYAGLVGKSGKDVLAYEEAQRFKDFERRASEFERVYVDFLVATRGGSAPPSADVAATGELAAVRAAAMGLYNDSKDGRVPEAVRLFQEIVRCCHASGATQNAITDALEARQLRFL